MFKVQLISKETIKPSSPTPSHLQFKSLSLLDQFYHPMYAQTLIFFGGTGDLRRSHGKATQLKESLSKTLTYFYPLAGRIKDPTIPILECNDEGVEFFETRVEGDLEPILLHPPIKELNQLLPYGLYVYQDWQPLLAIQLNEFADGGSVIGICISHQVADADSMTMFLNAWADVANGREVRHPPRFDIMASVFPPTTRFPRPPLALHPWVVPRRFVMNAPAIEKLRRDTYCLRSQFPTRVEAVMTLLWRCLIRATAAGKDGSLKPLASHAVCLRKKLMAERVGDRESLFGNLLTYTHVVGDSIDQVCEKKVQGLLEEKLREAISKVGEDYAREFAEGYLSDMHYKYMAGGVDPEIWQLTSWCRFSLYKTDFGWGEPVWLALGWQGFKNLVIIMDARDGEGVEAWVWLGEEEMGRFEKDPEILGMTSPQVSGI